MIEEIYPPYRRYWLARLLKWFFHLLYHPFAWSYDLVAGVVSMGRWRRWVMAALEMLEGPRVLELGFGPGHLQVQLHARGLHAVGLDESPQMARQAARRLRRQTFNPRLARGLAQRLPFASAVFDSVVATFPTQYIVDARTLAEVWRVLRPEGRLVVLFGAWHTGHSLPERLLALLFRLTGESPSAGPGDESAFTASFFQAGFRARVEWVEIPGSRLVFVLATRPTTPQESPPP